MALPGDQQGLPRSGEPAIFATAIANRSLVRTTQITESLRDRHPIHPSAFILLSFAVEPDLAIVKPLGNEYRFRRPESEDIFWVVEFSNSSLAKDLEIKRRVYATAEISEYWVVNLKTQTIIIFRDPAGGDYQSRQTLTEGTVYPVAFPDIAVSVAQILGLSRRDRANNTFKCYPCLVAEVLSAGA
ncbi:MAG: Uma2 family endonuclease [Leptolyngbyaceae cyanobacterium SM1_1_3]|nr:Uma2 family endonuclease [Leptolyngbyaceae cyanobacterium SM1_1_3]NJN04466.1 Uma2 family endonuclease [Leptolyngbyaceae cyanobacterium RM1_1_2]NJO10072.1 Uma2 family endonuclease [Leptolyngbyaceae cyanobacterium SL_1_1]